MMKYIKKYNESNCELADFSYNDQFCSEDKEKIKEIKSSMEEIFIEFTDDNFTLIIDYIYPKSFRVNVFDPKSIEKGSKIKLNEILYDVEICNSYFELNNYYCLYIIFCSELQGVKEFLSYDEAFKYMERNRDLLIYQCQLEYKKN